MSVSLDKIYDVLWESLTDVLGVSLMRADQKLSIPEEGIYGTIKLISGPIMSGHDSFKVEDEKEVVEGHRMFTLSVNLYRQGSLQLATDLQSLIQTSVFRYKVKYAAKDKDVDMAVIDALSVQNLTNLVQSDYEERAQLDVRLRAVSKIAQDIGIIERVTSDPDSGFDRYEGDPSRINVNLDVES